MTVSAAVTVGADGTGGAGVADPPDHHRIDETTPVVTLVLAPASISENGGASTVTARLSRASSEDVTGDGLGGAVAPAVAGDFELSANQVLTIAAGVGPLTRQRRRDLEHLLLEETVDAGVTRFVWLRQFEPGNNSADANRLLDRLEHLHRLDVPEGLFHDVPAHRITRLRRQGERYFADGLRELPDSRRLAILAVCAVEWELFLADAVVETNDRIVGRTYREAARTCDAQLGNETASVREALRAFAELGRALIGARDTGAALDAVIADGPGWEGLGDLVAMAAALASTVAANPLNHVLGGYRPTS